MNEKICSFVLELFSFNLKSKLVKRKIYHDNNASMRYNDRNKWNMK